MGHSRPVTGLIYLFIGPEYFLVLCRVFLRSSDSWNIRTAHYPSEQFFPKVFARGPPFGFRKITTDPHFLARVNTSVRII